MKIDYLEPGISSTILYKRSRSTVGISGAILYGFTLG